MKNVFLFGFISFILLPINSYAELMWRKVPVIPEIDRYGGPIIQDIALKPDGEIYVIKQSGIYILNDGQFKPFGGDAGSFGMSKQTMKNNQYLIRVAASSGSPKGAKTKLVRTDKRPEYQISGIAHRLAFTASGEMWVGADDGYIYRNHMGKTWTALKGVRADTVFVSHDGKTAIAKSDDPNFQSHIDWLKKNPNPYMLVNGKWKAQAALANAHSFAFDKASVPMALIFDPTSREYSLLQYQSNTWKQIEAPENIRNIQSDANGNVIALAYHSERVSGKGWVHTNKFIYRWINNKWERDQNLPELTAKFYLGKNYYGKLIEYNGLPTWVTEQSWVSVKDVEVKTPEKKAEPIAPPTLDANNTSWYGIIKVIDPSIQIDPAIVSAWEDGAYLYLKEDGSVGFNWDKAGDYGFDPTNSWEQDEDTLIIRFNVFMYAFSLKPPYTSGETTLGTAFKMNIERVED